MWWQSDSSKSKYTFATFGITDKLGFVPALRDSIVIAQVVQVFVDVFVTNFKSFKI